VISTQKFMRYFIRDFIQMSQERKCQERHFSVTILEFQRARVENKTLGCQNIAKFAFERGSWVKKRGYGFVTLRNYLEMEKLR